ncbi:basic proline-rich protein-like [Choloepus didactylus]|uniref:basic proline-rich protein-like n=1 Tax=Choloepus didactylus TaxID=27675 RepID=UPI00189FC45F|nr:basic proline-rich protein-like [Choloepus didactylus]
MPPRNLSPLCPPTLGTSAPYAQPPTTYSPLHPTATPRNLGPLHPPPTTYSPLCPPPTPQESQFPAPTTSSEPHWCHVAQPLTPTSTALAQAPSFSHLDRRNGPSRLHVVQGPLPASSSHSCILLPGNARRWTTGPLRGRAGPHPAQKALGYRVPLAQVQTPQFSRVGGGCLWRQTCPGSSSYVCPAPPILGALAAPCRPRGTRTLLSQGPRHSLSMATPRPGGEALKGGLTSRQKVSGWDPKGQGRAPPARGLDPAVGWPRTPGISTRWLPLLPTSPQPWPKESGPETRGPDSRPQPPHLRRPRRPRAPSPARTPQAPSPPHLRGPRRPRAPLTCAGPAGPEPPSPAPAPQAPSPPHLRGPRRPRAPLTCAGPAGPEPPSPARAPQAPSPPHLRRPRRPRAPLTCAGPAGPEPPHLRRPRRPRAPRPCADPAGPEPPPPAPAPQAPSPPHLRRPRRPRAPHTSAGPAGPQPPPPVPAPQAPSPLTCAGPAGPEPPSPARAPGRLGAAASGAWNVGTAELGSARLLPQAHGPHGPRAAELPPAPGDNTAARASGGGGS